MTAVTNGTIQFEQYRFFSFNNIVRGTQCDASSSIGQVTKVPGDDERNTELRNRLDLHQQPSSALREEHPKSAVSL